MFSLRRLLIKLAHGLLLRMRQAHEANQARPHADRPASASAAAVPAPAPAAPTAPDSPAVKETPKKKSAATRKPNTNAKAKVAAPGAGSKAKPAKRVAPVAKASPGRLRAGAEYEGTVWIPRILWALAWAKRNQAEPASPADLARILKEQAGINVAATNTARAFRDLKKDGRGAGLWSGDKQYKITPQGEKALAALVTR